MVAQCVSICMGLHIHVCGMHMHVPRMTVIVTCMHVHVSNMQEYVNMCTRGMHVIFVTILNMTQLYIPGTCCSNPQVASQGATLVLQVVPPVELQLATHVATRVMPVYQCEACVHNV